MVGGGAGGDLRAVGDGGCDFVTAGGESPDEESDERRGDAERVVILLNLLGREVRVKVPSNSIARVL